MPIVVSKTKFGKYWVQEHCFVVTAGFLSDAHSPELKFNTERAVFAQCLERTSFKTFVIV